MDEMDYLCHEVAINYQPLKALQRKMRFFLTKNYNIQYESLFEAFIGSQ